MTAASLVVAVDCFCVRQPIKGLARIGRSFVRTLGTAPPGWSFVLLGIDGPAWDYVPMPANARAELWPKPVSRTRWYRDVLPRLLRRLRPDLIHGLADFLPRLGGVPGVVTVTEDPMRRLDGGGVMSRLRGYEVMRSFRTSLRRSTSVLAISRSVADDLSSRYQYPQTRTRVAYPGVDHDLLAACPVEPDLGRYFLSFATGDRRERWTLVLEAFAEARRTEPGLVLAAVGGTACRGQAATPGVVHLGRVNDNELAGLYRGALGLVDVATFEGFGFQVLEACHFSTPIIASALPTVREIAGTTAVVHPRPDVAWLAETMRSVASDPDRFRPTPLVSTSWDGFAAAAWSVYADAVSVSR